LSSLRLLFGVLSPGLGGHTRTAVALAERLRSRGHHVEFAVTASVYDKAESASNTDVLIREAGFRSVSIRAVYAWPPRAFRRDLGKLVHRQRYDALHWFEFYDGVRDAALVAAAERCAFVWTVTSGGRPPGYFGLNRVVVFTPELAEDVRRRSPLTTVDVLPARVDFAALNQYATPAACAHVRSDLALDDDTLLIVRIARSARVYLRSVRLGVALAERFSAAGRAVTFLHAGYVQDEDVAREISMLIQGANSRAGRVIARSVTRDAQTAARYAAAADVCISSGRSALDTIALQRPTLVAWESRYLGLVDDKNITALAEMNFQGRHTPRVDSDDAIVTDMHEAICRRLADRDEAARVHATCARFVVERYSVERAVDVYEQLYEDRTITLDGALRHYSRPAHAAREIYYRLPARVRALRP
jgi:hypothetical protein